MGRDIALSCCFLSALFCGYGVVRSSADLGPIRQRGLVRGVSYVACTLVTLVPYAMAFTETELTWGWFTAKLLAAYIFRLNGAVNVSVYIFWMWRSRRLQERFDAERQRMDYESLVLETYFDVAGTDDTEIHEANRLT